MKISGIDTTTNLWSDAFLAWRGEGDFNNDHSNNNGRREGLILTKTAMKTPTVMTPWSATTSVFDITTYLWLDAFLAGTGGYLYNNDYINNDHKDDDARTTMTSFSDTTILLWLDAFLGGRRGVILLIVIMTFLISPRQRRQDAVGSGMSGKGVFHNIF